MDRRDFANERLIFSRRYLLGLIDTFDDEDWLRQPREGVTHLAWQVGHSAWAQYGLCLIRIRGEQPADADLIPAHFRERYGKGSVPDPDPAKNESPGELRRVLDAVHAESLAVLEELPEEEFDASAGRPHPAFETKYGSLLWSAAHEMIHAGQIGLLRRLLGQTPLR